MQNQHTDLGAQAPAPLVSVVIATYNYARFVRDAVDSALGQTYAPVDVIVVDDASTDATEECLRGYGDRIRVFMHEANRGQAGCLNTGFAAARGTFILFLDADDVMRPEAVAEAVAAWSDGVARVSFQLDEVDGALHALGCIAEEGDAAHCDPRRVRSMAALRTGPPTSGNLYLKAALAPYFPMEEGAWRAYTDVYCNALAALSGRLVTVAKPLALYRIHGRNLSLKGGYTLERIRRLLPIELNLRAALSAHGVPEAQIPKVSPRHVMLRLASYLMDRAMHPYAQDTRWSLWSEGMSSAGVLPLGARLAVALRFTALVLAPGFLARALLQAGLRMKTRQRSRRR